jgi:succinoglycan biosynthesis transport protein ExoP
MELRRYFTLVRRWIWLGMLGVVLGAAAGYMYDLRQIPLYQATTRFVVMMPAQSTDVYAYLSAQQLVQTYTQLLTTEKVLQAAAAQLGYPVSASQINAQQESSSQFVTITVRDENPQHAADIANVLVTTLMAQNQDLQSVRYATSQLNLQNQIDDTQSQITTLQSQISNISSETVQQQITQAQNQLSQLQKQSTDLQDQIRQLKYSYPTDANKAKLADLQATLAQVQALIPLYTQVYSNLVVLGQPSSSGSNNGNGNNSDPASTRLNQLQTTLNLYQQIYLNLLNSMQALQLSAAQNTPNVVQVEVASPASTPINGKPMQNLAFGGAIGLILAAGIAFLVEYLDDTVKNSDDIERLLKQPVVGYIAQIRYGSEAAESLYVNRQPRSPVTEAFRSLRTNLEFSGVDHPIRRLLVTSSAPNDGKSTIAANLAALIAQGGKRVILIDADLRRPSLHRFLGVSNRLGLSEVFRDHATLQSAIQPVEGLKNLSIITSGSLPPNPSELLGSAKMEQIMQEAEKEADMIVLDSPPTLVADVQIVSSKVDGVVIVIRPGHTHVDAALATLEQLNRAGARVLGVVLNRIPRERAEYYGGYRHYSPYYSGYHYYSYAKGEGSTTSFFRKLFSFGGNRSNHTTHIARGETLGKTAGVKKD